MYFGDPRAAAWYGKRAVLYIRVSTDEQARHGYSLEAQREDLLAFCERFHLQVVALEADEGVSARKPVNRRPALCRVLDRVRAGTVDYVLFIKLDRWFRSVAEYYRTQAVLEEAGVCWKATQEEYDTSTTNGRLNLNIRLSVAQDESDRTGDRIRFVFEQRVKNGGAISGSTPYGLAVVDHKLAIVEEQRQAVVDLFAHYEATGSASSCMRFLRSRFGVCLPLNSVRRMLRNPLYCGQYRGNLTYCPAIISPAQFERVQRLLEANSRGGQREKKHDYIFSGLLRCPECGRILQGNLASSYNRDGSLFTTYPRYRCAGHYLQKSCGYKAQVWEKRVEDGVLACVVPQLAQYVAQFDVAEAARRSAGVDTSKIQRKISRLQDLYLEEAIAIDAYRARYAALTAELEAAQAQAAPPPPRDLSAVRALLAGDFRAVYDTLTNTEKHLLWVSVIDRIEVTGTGHNKWRFDVIFL